MPKDPSAYRQPRSWPGMFLFMMGGVALFLTAPAGLPWVSTYGNAPWAMQAFLGSGALALLGGVWSVWAVTRPPPPKPKIDAADAFRQKSNKRQFDPLADAGAWTPSPGLARVQADEDEDGFSDLSEQEALDLQIQALKEKIARAKVMYGTGKLSKGGYAEYVNELQQELARLEGERLGVESASDRDVAGRSGARSGNWEEWEDPELR